MEASAAQVPYTWPRVAVVNDQSSGLDDSAVSAMVAAVEKQVLDHFGPAWHIGAHFEFYGVGKTAPAGRWVVALLGSSDQAGALGYHDLTPDGLPLGKVFAATDREYGSSVSVTLSHEVLEMLADPWIALAAQGADGRFYAWEVGDPVEDDSLGYEIDGVLVSAFVTPAWFGTGPGPLSYPDGRVSQPLTLAAGGYMSVFDPSSGQGWTQVDGQEASKQIGSAVGSREALEVIRAQPRVGSRRERRFRGRQLWVPSTYSVGS